MKQKILFLYLPTLTSKKRPFAPLGISVLGGYLRRRGIEVYLDDLDTRCPLGGVDEVNLRKEFTAYIEEGVLSGNVEARLKEWENSLKVTLGEMTHVGFSVMSFSQLLSSVAFGKYLKGKYALKIILGGSFMTSRMEILLKRYAYLDYLIINEGEVALWLLLRGDKESEIENLIYREGAEVRQNRASNSYAQDLEPDFEGLPFELYSGIKTPLMHYELSKGCRNNCKFCTTKGKLYFKDISRAVADICRIKEKYHSRYFMFVDNAINLDRKYLQEFCRELIEQKADISWSAYCIPDEELDEEIFHLMREAGCVQLRWGLETPSEAVLKDMGKKIEPKMVLRLLARAQEHGIWNHLILMLGYPGETWRDFAGMLKFIFRERRYIKSVLINYFRLDYIDLEMDSAKQYQGRYPNGEITEEEVLGIKHRYFKDKYLSIKVKVLIWFLARCGISCVTSHQRIEKDLIKDNYFFAVFTDSGNEPGNQYDRAIRTTPPIL